MSEQKHNIFDHDHVTVSQDFFHSFFGIFTLQVQDTLFSWKIIFLYGFDFKLKKKFIICLQVYTIVQRRFYEIFEPYFFMI